MANVIVEIVKETVMVPQEVLKEKITIEITRDEAEMIRSLFGELYNCGSSKTNIYHNLQAIAPNSTYFDKYFEKSENGGISWKRA